MRDALDVGDETLVAFADRVLPEAQLGEGDTLLVTPPSWRIDMTIWQDVAEEVARLHGYAELPETLPTLRTHASNIGASAANDERQNLRRTLAALEPADSGAFLHRDGRREPAW